MGVTVAHVCDHSRHWRAGACQAPCTPTFADCGDEVTSQTHDCG